MISEKDKIEQFKRELRSYDFYLKKVASLNLELEAIGVKLIGVSSPHAKEVICENSRNPYANNKLELMYQEEKIIAERNHYLRQVEMIDERLDSLKSNERELLIELYIRRKPFDKKADDMFCSVPSLYRLVNRIIGSIVN